MKEKELKSQVIEKVFSELDLLSDSPATEADRLPDTEAMHFLTKRIEELLDRDSEKLKQILYRIDVDESRLGKLLSQCRPGEEAEIIARQIVERQTAKIKTRLLYREGKL